MTNEILAAGFFEGFEFKFQTLAYIVAALLFILALADRKSVV